MARWLTALALAALAMTSAASQACAVVPSGARLAVIAHGDPNGTELFMVGPGGEHPEPALRSGPEQIGWLAGDRLSWSADGRLMAFAAPGKEEQPGQTLAVAQEGDSGIRVYPRVDLSEGGDPLIAPDGRSVVFQRVKLVKVLPGRENYLFKSSVWSFDLERRSLRQLTRWRVGTFLWPSSFSPDGSTVAAGSFGRQGFRAVAIDVRSGHLSLLAPNAWEPTYSPDGSRLAFVRLLNWLSPALNDAPPSRQLVALYVASADGGNARRLVRRRGLIAWPSWDPSGSRISFTQSLVEDSRSLSPLEGDKVMAINAEGTCLTKVFSDPETTLFGASWQPGPDREAGPISC
jgi:Tol biopolymer transport system component